MDCKRFLCKFTVWSGYSGNSSEGEKHSECYSPRLKFPNDFGQILGINPLWSEKAIGNEKNVFTYSVDLNGPYDRLYLYSDVATFTNVGDTQAPILRILPFEPNQTLTNFHMEFRRLYRINFKMSRVFDNTYGSTIKLFLKSNNN